MGASYERQNSTNSICAHGNANVIFIKGKYKLLLREINSDNHNYYETSWDRHEEFIFESLPDLKFLSIKELGLTLVTFIKPKNSLYFKNAK